MQRSNAAVRLFMEEILFFASGMLILANLISILMAAWRLSSNGVSAPPIADRPPVSIVIPARGIETFTRQTLSRAFQLDWARYELIFCVADGTDAIIAEIDAAIIAHPLVPARILVGDDRISANPKLNNCVKGWQAARHDWVVLADSNVLMPPDYLQHLMAAGRWNTGLVCSTPLGSLPDSFWAEVECAFLNSHQTRWQYAGEAMGFGFAQGKSMLWYKQLLDANGGIGALAAEIAEDAAATKLVRRLGRKVHLVASPFEQPLGSRNMREVWSRQRRWARLRRVTFSTFFAPEILLGGALPFALAVTAATIGGTSPATAAAIVVTSIYLPELLFAYAKNWHMSLWSLPAMIVRDLIMPVIWLRSWLGGQFEWRGNSMTVGTLNCELEEMPGHPHGP